MSSGGSDESTHPFSIARSLPVRMHKVCELMKDQNKFQTSKIVNEYDQEIPQSQTADNPVAP